MFSSYYLVFIQEAYWCNNDLFKVTTRNHEWGYHSLIDGQMRCCTGDYHSVYDKAAVWRIYKVILTLSPSTLPNTSCYRHSYTICLTWLRGTLIIMARDEKFSPFLVVIINSGHKFNQLYWIFTILIPFHYHKTPEKMPFLQMHLNTSIPALYYGLYFVVFFRHMV